jgi:RimJ/RimL family protein N-acetyltransferase
MEIFSEARESIGRLGIDQWQNGYPNAEVLREDIANGFSYAVREEEKDDIIATFCLKEDEEPTYKQIYGGSWINSEESFALHRIAICNAKKGSGVANAIVEFILGKCRDNNVPSLKVDTHEGNLPMRRMLERNGFEYCGIIYLLDGAERLAYQQTRIESNNK